jgi:hypothetical protein
MLLVIQYDDGTEQGYEVPDGTNLLSALRDDYWIFQTLSGGQIAVSADTASKLTLGNVELVSGG